MRRGAGPHLDRERFIFHLRPPLCVPPSPTAAHGAQMAREGCGRVHRVLRRDAHNHRAARRTGGHGAAYRGRGTTAVVRVRAGTCARILRRRIRHRRRQWRVLSRRPNNRTFGKSHRAQFSPALQKHEEQLVARPRICTRRRAIPNRGKHEYRGRFFHILALAHTNIKKTSQNTYV